MPEVRGTGRRRSIGLHFETKDRRVLHLSGETNVYPISLGDRSGHAVLFPVDERGQWAKASAVGTALEVVTNALIELHEQPGAHTHDDLAAAQGVPVDGTEDGRFMGLTKQQRAVLRLLSHGERNKEIAGELGISPRTVRFHVSNIYSKLGINTRGEAGRVVIVRGLWSN